MERASEGPRALATTGFTAALDALLDALPEVRCAVFIDEEGETIDLSTRIELLAARVAGAELSLPLDTARKACRTVGLGALIELRFEGDSGAVLARSVGEGCGLVVLSSSPRHSPRAISRCAAAVESLRAAMAEPRRRSLAQREP